MWIMLSVKASEDELIQLIFKAAENPGVRYNLQRKPAKRNNYVASLLCVCVSVCEILHQSKEGVIMSSSLLNRAVDHIKA